ncbi:hypothetical protein VN12_19245 [Pirellula sp. SH-Sr6A]|uniref:hypothetical protein n=1 Tax=Pirellula sp. SH-Sr6A TaxID=1632865 RepID=UPI00078EC523|nr:hypothetical protein [Pirellula sp. SH-Sr6A]AMV34270.1 hypothetical protein VN12_19245 [Pirellula sp. SH-Sr6A]
MGRIENAAALPDGEKDFQAGEKESLDEFQLQAVSPSSTYPPITFDSVHGLPIVHALIAMQEAVQRMVSGLDAQANLNYQQSQTFTAEIAERRGGKTGGYR